MVPQDPIDRRVTRCAIYTRKSTERGLDLAVNSLETQRDVCSSYIKCQAHRNWVELPHHFDDGGYSGGTLVRPALNQLIADVEAGRIDIVVIYKIDRLTRSLLDFVRLIDVFEKHGVSFVSVTQSFDTSDSMGRLILNVLLTFAQFERELMSDRVRDKKAAMIRRGLFAGGLPPFGYLVSEGGRLIVDDERSVIVRELFERYPQASSVRELVTDLRARGCRTRRWVTSRGITKGGQPITAAIVRQVLSNPIYTGFIEHRSEWIEAQVTSIITREQWDLVQAERLARRPTRNPDRDFLLGILYDELGRKMGICDVAPGSGHKERYYKGQDRSIRGRRDRSIFVIASNVESIAVGALKAFLVDRAAVTTAVMSLGRYNDEVAKLLGKGRTAARRIEQMNQAQLRRLFIALIPRAQVGQADCKLWVSCHELARFLEWDGAGIFSRLSVQPTHQANEVHLISAPVHALCGKRFYSIPISRRTGVAPAPKPWLVDIIYQAAEMRAFVMAHRDKSIAELAKMKRIGPTHLSQLLRANYLAPDIQAAIIDGDQPPNLTAYDLLKRPLPMDWEQQRQILGFAEPPCLPRGLAV